MKALIKAIAAAWLCLALGWGVGMAQTRYISEEFEVPMRSGQSGEHRIIALIPSGRAVELVSPGDEWSMVRLPGGREGWVLTRYLSDKMPSAMQLERLERRHAEIVQQHQALQTNASKLAAENSRLSNDLNQTKEQMRLLQEAHETLKRESAQFISLKEAHEENQQALSKALARAGQLESALDHMANSQLYQGLLYGGALVIVGFIAGFVLKKPKRRSLLI